MLPGVCDRLTLPGTGKPIMSELNVRDTESNGDSG